MNKMSKIFDYQENSFYCVHPLERSWELVGVPRLHLENYCFTAVTLLAGFPLTVDWEEGPGPPSSCCLPSAWDIVFEIPIDSFFNQLPSQFGDRHHTLEACAMCIQEKCRPWPFRNPDPMEHFGMVFHVMSQEYNSSLGLKVEKAKKKTQKTKNKNLPSWI